MKLSQKIAAALDARPDSGALPCETSAEEGPHRLSIHLTAGGPVGLAFDQLNFSTSGGPDLSTEALKGWGDRLAGRLSYLMEPLVVLEVDAEGGEVELRSRTPTARGGRSAYYEIRLNRRGTLRLGRVSFDEASRRRQPTPCQMTREGIERLADDLVASVG